MPFVGGSPMLRQVDERNWELMEPLDYFGRSDRFIIPGRYYDTAMLEERPGYITDFASVPRAFVWLIPAFGKYTKAAILHDWLITDRPDISSRDTDGLFRRVLREERVGVIMRWLMWTGVRWGALANPDRREGWWRGWNIPLVLFWSLVGILLTLVPAVINQLFLWLYNLLELVTTAIKPGEKPTTGAGSTT